MWLLLLLLRLKPTVTSPVAQALVDAPGETRRIVNFKRLALTGTTIEVPRLASKKVLTKAFADAGE